MVPSTPTPSPKGDPQANSVDCYNDGQKTEHERIDNTIADFCNQLGSRRDILGENFFYTSTFTLPNSGGGLGVNIVTSLSIAQGYY